MSSYDLFGRSAVLRERAKMEGAYAGVRLQYEIIRLADTVELEYGFEALLHTNLAIVRSKATMRQPLLALDCLDAAMQRLIPLDPKRSSPLLTSGD